MKPLDFLIIGAQKCATTALFEHLKHHRGICMPREKEVPFFAGKDYRDTEWKAFASAHFGLADERLWGKATPQYMGDPRAAARIHALMPDIKLVAILRDPIERSWSHYQMARRRGTEARSFDQAIEPLLAADFRAGEELPSHASGYESEADYYLAWSEYGRALRPYYERFPASNILVLYAEELDTQPEATLDRLLAFLGLEPGFRPDSLGERIHQGGSGNKIPEGLRHWLRDRGWLYALWQRLPAERRGELRFRYEQWNVKRSSRQAPGMPEMTRARLRSYFAKDLAQLTQLPVASPPWGSQYDL